MGASIGSEARGDTSAESDAGARGDASAEVDAEAEGVAGEAVLGAEVRWANIKVTCSSMSFILLTVLLSASSPSLWARISSL